MNTNESLKKNLRLVISLALLVRILLILIFQKDWSFMNQDENNNYTIAQNYLLGHGYSLWDAGKHAWVSTSFHSTFNVFLYMGLQMFHISTTVWVVFIQFISTLLYAISAIYFLKLSQKVLADKYALWATILYLFFPSTVFYVGPLFAYENIVAPFLIITFWQLLQVLQGQWRSNYWFSIPVMATISILIRPNILLVYACLFLFIIILSLRKSNVRAIILSILTGGIIAVAHIPTLEKNKKQFGAYILNTQSGFEMLQGHNPTARGSWRGGWQEPGNPLYEYAHTSIAGIDSMNEYQESKARQQLAIQWICQNPEKEIQLNIRKLGIYFLPKNYEVMPLSQIPNPINAIVYLLAIVGIGMLTFKKQLSATWFIYITPLIGSIGVSMVYFVGYRWRFYAEPFLCLLAIFAIQQILTKKNTLNIPRA
ncbi:MAG: glycosyltransferase family 39 protein [Bacteroidota bacterium]